MTIHMASASDTKRALARTKNKIKTSLFRLFRWTPDFELGKDSSLEAVWVKMCNLPLNYFNESSLHRPGSILGTVLSIHPSTIGLTQQAYAKVCIELDVSKPFLDKLWIGTSKDYGWEVTLEYEGNHAYCQYCGLLGHSIGLCQKKRQDRGKGVDYAGKELMPRDNSTKTRKNEKWVAKDIQHHGDDGKPDQQRLKEGTTIPGSDNVTAETLDATPVIGILKNHNKGLLSILVKC